MARQNKLKQNKELKKWDKVPFIQLFKNVPFEYLVVCLKLWQSQECFLAKNGVLKAS